MFCCLDVQYQQDQAATAAVLFPHWGSEQPSYSFIHRSTDIEPYQPGEFYRRELPCLLAALGELEERPSLVIIDGHVWLDNEKPGLGARLWEAFDRAIPVVGLAKSPWKAGSGEQSLPVNRGSSERPLWLSAAGISPTEAAKGVMEMHGPHRLPTLIKLADSLCRAVWREPA